MEVPSLFSYATSELSQDAFICWFIEWASPEYRDSDPELHECGVLLIDDLFSKHSIDTPKNIYKVGVSRQVKNVDVLCIINDTYAILIEDKTGTKQHSDQLFRYLESVKEMGYERQNIIPIYFKTEEQSDFKPVLKYGFQPYLRNEFLDILDSYSGNNSIMKDYRGYLRSISNKVESYTHINIKEWGWYAWVGFYQEMQKRLGDGRWDYVANPNGGFAGFWWCFQGDGGCEQYLQLEEDKFCFKIKVINSEERIHLRSKWHHILMDNSKAHGLKLVKPKRFGSGQFMTVCILENEYRNNERGVINMDKTEQLLRQAQSLLKSVRNHA